MNEKRKKLNKKILKFGCLPIIVIFGLLLIIGTFADKEEKKMQKKIVKVDNTEQRTEAVYKEFMFLYHELLEFKDDADFKKYGFSKNQPYYKWMKSVEELENNPDSKLLLEKGILVNDLLMLGMQYVNSKGKENKITKELNKLILR